MTCVHLKKLYQLCHEHEVKLASSDLIQIICKECGETEVCPSMLMDDYDRQQAEKQASAADDQDPE
jgi:hypothetical protein